MNDDGLDVNKRKWIAMIISLLSSQWLDLDEINRPQFNHYVQHHADNTINLMRYAGHVEETVKWTRDQFDEVIRSWVKPE